MSDDDVTFGGLGRFLRWAFATSIVLGLAIWLLSYADGDRSSPWWAFVVAFPVAFNLVLGPMLWLRFEHFGRYTKRHWAAFGLSVAWAVVTGALLVAFLAVLDVD